ncbi:MAG: hypothetical protein JST30_09115 [Armatimonadetes bacterium]|nr:hypothetical protein [Armatimonadota bacterium]
MDKSNLKTMAFGFIGAAALWSVAASGPAVAQVEAALPAFVRIQTSTPGTPQAGHSNVTGTVIAGQFQGGGSGLSGVNADLLDGLNSTSFLQSVPVPLALTGAVPVNAVVRATNTSTSVASSGVTGEATSTTGTVYGVSGIVASTAGRAIYGEANATTGASSAGYFNNDSVAGYGVRATSDGAFGVYGTSTLVTGIGVYGAATNTGSGAGNYGVYGETAGFNGAGVFGESLSTTGANFGGRFRNASTSGVGVSAATTALTGSTFAGRFENNSTSGRAVFAYSLATTGTTYGVYGSSASDTGFGVFGSSSSNTGVNFGVRGENASTSGRAVSGYASNTSGTNYGGHFEAEGGGGRGVLGLASNASGTNYGGHFTAAGSFGRGVYGAATDATGQNYGGYFQSFSTDGDGVRGIASASGGAQNGGVFLAQSAGGFGAIAIGEEVGLTGEAEASDGAGVVGSASSSSTTTTHYGVRGVISAGSNGWGVYSTGPMGASGTKSFRIDHPFDPANKYLLHFSTESPTPQNFYVGNTRTDASGRAWVTLPDYFAAINTNFKYQLTVIGDDESEDFVQVKVAKKIQGNRFLIMTSRPKTEVSWRVDADRNDAWVQAHPSKDVVEKLGREKGTFQHPEFFGFGPERSMESARTARTARAAGASHR